MTAATVAKARALKDRVLDAKAADEARIAREERDQKLLLRLGDARGMRGKGFEAAKTDEAFAGRFSEAGLDPDRPEEWRERLRDFSRPDELLAALDAWVVVRRDAEGDPESLDRLVRDLDPDDFRDRVRTLRAEEDVLGLRALRREEPLEDVPTRDLLLLADALGCTGDAADAVALCRMAHQKDPYDFWPSFELAFWLVQLSPPKTTEAVPYFSKALSQRPESRWRKILTYPVWKRPYPATAASSSPTASLSSRPLCLCPSATSTSSSSESLASQTHWLAQPHRSVAFAP